LRSFAGKDLVRLWHVAYLERFTRYEEAGRRACCVVDRWKRTPSWPRKR